jgi:hypothetical protein
MKNIDAPEELLCPECDGHGSYWKKEDETYVHYKHCECCLSTGFDPVPHCELEQ